MSGCSEEDLYVLEQLVLRCHADYETLHRVWSWMPTKPSDAQLLELAGAYFPAVRLMGSIPARLFNKAFGGGVRDPPFEAVLHMATKCEPATPENRQLNPLHVLMRHAPLKWVDGEVLAVILALEERGIYATDYCNNCFLCEGKRSVYTGASKANERFWLQGVQIGDEDRFALPTWASLDRVFCRMTTLLLLVIRKRAGNMLSAMPRDVIQHHIWPALLRGPLQRK